MKLPAQLLLEAPGFRDRCWLVKNGVPFDVAFSMTSDEVLAFTVAFGELEGNSFDWRTMAWKERK